MIPLFSKYFTRPIVDLSKTPIFISKTDHPFLEKKIGVLFCTISLLLLPIKITYSFIVARKTIII